MTSSSTKPLLAAVAALSLSACATREGFEARQSALIGRSEAELVATLGVPARTYDAEGRRFLQYEDRRLVSYGGGYPYGGLGFGFGRRGFGTGLGFGFGAGYPLVETRGCDTTFELRSGRVVGFSARGNACVATPPHAA